MIVECNVWCIANPEAERLGLPEGDTWMPFIIDFKDVKSIKLCGPNDFIGDDKATLYLDGNHVTIDITFDEAKRLFYESRH
jgi:hypothetical protein